MKPWVLTVVIAAALGLAAPIYSQDDNLCLDCHEPAEDWEGMTAEAILENAMDGSIKRHLDNKEFSEEQLKAMIAELLAKPAAE
ncbi:MAG: hypothetical protein Hals2KO_28420 [Halioglobus sp.]